MMAQFAINIGKPQNFADWTQYAGFNPNQSMIGLSPQQKLPVAPPTASQVTQTMSNVGSDLAKGNFADAYKTYTTGVPPTVANLGVPKVTPPVINDGMSHDFED